MSQQTPKGGTFKMKKIITQDETHRRFSGIIYSSDFSTEYQGTKNMAARIMSDWRFDEECMKNSQNQERKNNYGA